MALHAATSSTSALQQAARPSTQGATSSRLPQTPPLPPIRHSSSQHTLRHAAASSLDPPSTPPNKYRNVKRKQSLGGRQSNHAKKEQKQQQAVVAAQQDTRHSHGLSWHSTTRDSLVDNLLTSLDGLSQLAHRDYDEEARQGQQELDWSRFDTLNAIQNKMPRARGHTYSSSLSSDFPVPDSPASNGSTRNRRSASSSNFGVHHSTRSRPSRADESVNSKKFGKSQAAVQTTSHTREWSDAFSTDQQFMDALETPRIPPLGASMSVDNIRPGSTGHDSILNRGRPVPSVYSTFDAAPEPMVPAGPRKLQNPNAYGPVYVNAAPKQSALRKITTQSDLRSVSTPNTIPLDVREKAGDFVRANSMMDAAERAGVGVSSTTQTRAQSPHREKPGFFKRVFGGKSTNDRVESNAVEHKAVNAPVPPKQESRQVSTDHSAFSTQLQQQQPPPPTAAPTLNKKPSSFFRRRKKSTSDVDRPALPQPLTLADRVQSQESRASISSLRKIMDPFLNEDPSKTDSRVDYSRPTTRASVLSDDIDIFHSGYTPPVVDVSRTMSRTGDGDSPRMKVKLKKRLADMPPTTATSQSSSLAVVDAALLTQSTLAYVDTGDNAKVSPLSDHAPSLHEERQKLSQLELMPTPEATQEMREFAAGNNVDLNMDSDTWLVTHDKAMIDKAATPSPRRLVLQPSEEKLFDAAQEPAVTAVQKSSTNDMTQAESRTTETAHVVATQPADKTTQQAQIGDAEASTAYIDADAEPKERARRVFEGNEKDVTKMEAASWLGESKTLNTRTLHEYMHLYDFSQMNILTALRTLCMNLVLRGETQQFDRIITALSSRWCECNANHGFKAQDVVHTICYSLILLNTDLHLADIGEKMSKSAYVKNTLPTIRRVVADAAPNAFDAPARPPIPWTDSSLPSSPSLPPDTPQERTSFENSRPNAISKRNSVRPGTLRSESDGWADTTSSNALVSSAWHGAAKGWENEIESILKSFFASIRNEPLPLLSLTLQDQMPSERNLSVNNPALKRTGSVVSKAPSEAISARSRGTGLRNLTLGWQGRNNRSRQKVFSMNTMSSSQTSFDDNNSMWSPAQSSTWSKNSMGKTLTSTSMNSLAASYMTGDREFKHSIGFANALSHAIIREEGGGIINGDSDSFTIKGDLLDDESLTLEGAPWAKEGMVKHKHHLEAPDRKAKDRNWSECFAVISRGKLTLFNFNTEVKTRSLGRPRTKQGSQAPSLAGTRVGGGDWMENAEQLGVFVLRHTISSTLPPPGYSKARPFVWALSLPSGAVHLFQVGTPDIAEEWMTTANYWSARLSKEPLSGGVSNVEYGWSEGVINSAVLEKSESFNSPPPSSFANRTATHGRTSSAGTGTRQSIQSSIRGSFDVGSSRQRLPGDKVHITEWSPPGQSIMASTLPEADQLRSLTTYVANVEAELETHHELKHAIELAFSPRHSNYNKAMSNWQRKSEYLLREVVKFRTYIDSLLASQKSKDEVYARRAGRGQARAAHVAATLSPDDGHLRRTSSNISASTVSLHVSDS